MTRIRPLDDIRSVLDNGYVRLVDFMGGDLSVANAARASYAKESAELSDKDRNLIRFLAREGHMSPFRHAFFTFEVKGPLMVARQWWKYVVGSDHTMDAWNEASRRYITIEPEFYLPAEWRMAPENSKQGSGGPADERLQAKYTAYLEQVIDVGLRAYEEALADGLAPEQARGLLGGAYFMHTIWRWSCSLQSLAHFLKERLAEDAQSEIRAYAEAIVQLVPLDFHTSLESLGLTFPQPVGKL